MDKLNNEGNTIWYLDTGATSHMTGNKQLFTTLNTNVKGTVRLGDNSCVQIEGKGSILIETKNGEHRLLTDILYIPYLKSNVLSIGQAEEGGCKIEIKHGVLSMFEPDGTLLMRVQRSLNRLYKINLKSAAPVCLLTRLDNPAWLWHAHLGHVNFDTIKRLGSGQLVEGVPQINHPKQLCEACLAGKHSRYCFPCQTTFSASNPLEQVYADLCGPISPTSPSGNKYIILFVDDYSKYIWSYMLKAKDEAFEQFKKFKATVENQYGRKIKVLRSDCGGEFTSKEFMNFCELAGILRQLTVPYTPQQNGIVERRNRTVMSTARSILNAMNMPQYFWAEAVRHAVYVLNRLRTKFLKDKTPYEALKGNKPNLGHIRVFGCVGHVKTPSNLTRKLDDRSIPMVHLGFEPGTKGYRMYDMAGKKVVISRNVIFEESKKWDWHGGRKDHELTDITEKDFVIHPDMTPTEQQGPSEVQSEESSPNPSQNVNPQHESNESEGSHQPMFESPQPGITGRGPMLPRLPTDIVNPANPSLAIEDTYDNTPPQGWKNLSEIYDLLLSEGEPTTYEDATGHKEWELAMESEISSIERNKTW